MLMWIPISDSPPTCHRNAVERGTHSSQRATVAHVFLLDGISPEMGGKRCLSNFFFNEDIRLR